MTQARGPGAQSERGESGPLGTLAQFVERARQIDTVDIEATDSQDPLGALETLMERAKRQQEGEGGEALRRLKKKIEVARHLPEAQEYRRPAGDPLEVLEARMRGELVDDQNQGPEGRASDVDARAQAGGKQFSGASAATKGGGQRRLGAVLESSLRDRALPGDIRAEVALQLAQIMESIDDDRLQDIWELVVFET